MSNEVKYRKGTSTPDVQDSDGDHNIVNEDYAANKSELSHIAELETSAENITDKIQSASLKDNEFMLPELEENNCQYKVTCTIIKSNITNQQEPFEFTVNSDCSEITAILNSVKTTATSFLVGLNDDMICQQDRPPSEIAAALSAPQSNRIEEAFYCEPIPEVDGIVLNPKIILNELQTTLQRRDLLKNQDDNTQSMSDSKEEINKAQDNKKDDNVYVQVEPTERGFRLTIFHKATSPAHTSAKSGENAECNISLDIPLFRIDVETIPETDSPILIKSCEENKIETINQDEPESDNNSNESNGN